MQRSSGALGSSDTCWYFIFFIFSRPLFEKESFNPLGCHKRPPFSVTISFAMVARSSNQHLDFIFGLRERFVHFLQEGLGLKNEDIVMW